LYFHAQDRREKKQFQFFFLSEIRNFIIGGPVNQLIKKGLMRGSFFSCDIGNGDDWLHVQNVSGFCQDHPLVCRQLSKILSMFDQPKHCFGTKVLFFYPQTVDVCPKTNEEFGSKTL
jgi:hypothetical protein